MQHLKLILLAVVVAGCAFCVEGSPQRSLTEQTKFLESVDEIIERGTRDDYAEAKRLLLEHTNQYGENSSLLWRLAKCCFRLKIEDTTCSNAKKAELLEEGLQYAEKAVRLNGDDGDAHKWFSILTGEKGNTLGMKERVNCGYLFKKHLDRAIALKPDDPVLHHLNGAFQYELGKLSWLERTLASALFGSLSKSPMKDALESLHRARTLNYKPWKMNCVAIAKCYFQQGNKPEAKKWLDEAAAIQVTTEEDSKAQEEITSLRKSFKV